MLAERHRDVLRTRLGLTQAHCERGLSRGGLVEPIPLGFQVMKGPRTRTLGSLPKPLLLFPARPAFDDSRMPRVVSAMPS